MVRNFKWAALVWLLILAGLIVTYPLVFSTPFQQRLGALVAGLLIGVIESLSAYLIGAVYKDMVVYALVLGFLWFRPQGLMGET